MTHLPDAVLLDMDGTLTDTETLWFEAETRVMESLGREWKAGDELAIIGRAQLDAAAYLVDAFELDLKPAELSHMLVSTVISLGEERGMPWRPGALELLNLLVKLGIPSALVTSSPAGFAQMLIDMAPQGSLTAMVNGDSGLPGKPDPAPYAHAAELLGADVTRSVAFEDSIPGLTSAHAAGARTIGVPLKVDLPKLEGVTFIDSLEQVDEDFLRF